MSEAVVMENTKRIQQNLDYIAANPSAKYPAGWIAEVQNEARAAGLLPAAKGHLGCNCPRNPYPATYGGDMEDIF